MKPTPLTNMEGRYVTPVTKDAFDALAAMGYESMLNYSTHLAYNAKYLFIANGSLDSVSRESSIYLDDLKQAYFHKGHFYDEPYEEFTMTEYSEDRISLAQEIAETLKVRGFWVPDNIASSDLILAVGNALDLTASYKNRKAK